MVWLPFDRVAVLRLKLNGDVVSVDFSTLSTYNSTFDTPTASEAVADTVMVPETVAPLAGEVIETAGAVVSLTDIVKLPFAVLPDRSVAEQLTVVVAIGNVEPETGLHVTGREPSLASVAVAV